MFLEYLICKRRGEINSTEYLGEENRRKQLPWKRRLCHDEGGRRIQLWGCFDNVLVHRECLSQGARQRARGKKNIQKKNPAGRKEGQQEITITRKNVTLNRERGSCLHLQGLSVAGVPRPARIPAACADSCADSCGPRGPALRAGPDSPEHSRAAQALPGWDCCSGGGHGAVMAPALLPRRGNTHWGLPWAAPQKGKTVMGLPWPQSAWGDGAAWTPWGSSDTPELLRHPSVTPGLLRPPRAALWHLWMPR